MGYLCSGQGLSETERSLTEKYLTRKDGKILEVGCGGGRVAIPLSLQGYDVTGIDLADRMVKTAIENARTSGVTAIVEVGNARDLKYGDDTFDYALMLAYLIGHIPGRANRITALRETNRVLKPGGILIADTNSRNARLIWRLYFGVTNNLRKLHNPHGLEPNDAFIFRTGGRLDLFKSKKERAVFHWYTAEEFISDAAEAGLELVEWGRHREWGGMFYVLRKPSAHLS
ncbi:MAG: methyltransferase domain-containing protein [Chloroflexi bacterium]|nr:methyltransferase domain-containing protein [Chloroflexota bacterium]